MKVGIVVALADLPAGARLGTIGSGAFRHLGDHVEHRLASVDQQHLDHRGQSIERPVSGAASVTAAYGFTLSPEPPGEDPGRHSRRFGMDKKAKTPKKPKQPKTDKKKAT